MAGRLQMEGDDYVLLHVTHSNLKSFAADVRFSLQMSVEAVMAQKLLFSLIIQDHLVSSLLIIDLHPSWVTTGGWLEDTSLVEKYYYLRRRVC